MHSKEGTAGERKGFFEYLRLDVRSLGLFRVLLGLAFAYNLFIVKWSFIRDLLSLDGMLPYAFMQQMSKGTDPSLFAFPWMRTDLAISIYLWLFAAMIALFTLGIRARLMALLIFLFHANLMQATMAFTFGMDYVGLHLIFWSIFLPVGRAFQIGKKEGPFTLPSLPVSALLLLQISCIYLFTAIFKFGIPWQEGYAAKFMLMDHVRAWGTAGIIRSEPFLYRSVTYGTLLVEYVVVFLLFVKWRWQTLRIVAAFTVFLFHLFIVLSSDVSGFSFFGFAIAAVLLPGSFWERLRVGMKSAVASAPLRPVLRWTVTGLQLLAAVIILQRCIYNYYLARGDEVTLNRMQPVMIPKVIKASLFAQNWNMFAPNPSRHIGGFGIVEYQDRVDDKVSEFEFIFNMFKRDKGLYGLEESVLDLLKSKFYQMQSSPGKRNLMSFWLEWKIRQHPGFTGDFNEYLLVEYRALLDFNREFYEPPIDTIFYLAPAILEGRIEPIRQ